MAETRVVAEGSRDVVLGESDSVGERMAEGEVACDCGREGAACAVRVFRVDVRSREPEGRAVGEEEVVGAVVEMTAFHEDGSLGHGGDFLRGLHHLFARRDFRHVGECGGLGEVRGDDVRERKENLNQRLFGGFLQKPVVRGGDHDGVEDDVLRVVFRQSVGDRLDDSRVCEHTDFHGVGKNVREDAVNLRGDEFGRRGMDGLDAHGVLRGQRGDDGHAIDLVGAHGLQVRLDVRASNGVRASDSQYSLHVNAPK